MPVKPATHAAETVAVAAAVAQDVGNSVVRAFERCRVDTGVPISSGPGDRPGTELTLTLLKGNFS